MRLLNLIFTIAFSLLFFSSNAQRLSLGGKLAFNNTAVYNKNIFDQVDYVRTGANSYGAQLNVMFTRKWGVTSDILLANQNQKYTLVDATNTFNGESKFTYLDVPVLLKRKNRIGLYTEFGPMLSFLMSAKETVFNSDGSLNYTDKDFKDDFNNFGVSLVGGLGWDIKLSKRLMINIEGRVGYMLTDVTTDYSNLSKEELLIKLLKEEISLNTYSSNINENGDVSYAKSTRIFTGVNVGLNWILVPMNIIK
jgi:hypothetical protein